MPLPRRHVREKTPHGRHARREWHGKKTREPEVVPSPRPGGAAKKIGQLSLLAAEQSGYILFLLPPNPLLAWPLRHAPNCTRNPTKKPAPIVRGYVHASVFGVAKSQPVSHPAGSSCRSAHWVGRAFTAGTVACGTGIRDQSIHKAVIMIYLVGPRRTRTCMTSRWTHRRKFAASSSRSTRRCPAFKSVSTCRSWPRSWTSSSRSGRSTARPAAITIRSSVTPAALCKSSRRRLAVHRLDRLEVAGHVQRVGAAVLRPRPRRGTPAIRVARPPRVPRRRPRRRSARRVRSART